MVIIYFRIGLRSWLRLVRLSRPMSISRPRWRRLCAAVLPYGVAVLAVLAALALGAVLSNYLRSMAYVSLLLCAIMFAAWFGGLGPDRPETLS